MENLQILITDSSAEFLDALTERLRGDFSVATCQNGRRAWEMIQQEQPGILVLDLLFAGAGRAGVCCSSFHRKPSESACVMTNFLSNYVVEACQKLGVSYLMRKPCDLDATARRVRDMAEELRPPTVTLADPRTTVSNMLLRLGIPTKMRGYAFLREAVLVMAHDRTQSVTKELYPTVAQRCGGEPTASGADHPGGHSLRLGQPGRIRLEPGVPHQWPHPQTDEFGHYLPAGGTTGE